ncbi:Protein of unknown function [Gryllus bimaculatus]|nr:Protein of unknown function [Gryllus bimaculatus]
MVIPPQGRHHLLGPHCPSLQSVKHERYISLKKEAKICGNG